MPHETDRQTKRTKERKRVREMHVRRPRKGTRRKPRAQDAQAQAPRGRSRERKWSSALELKMRYEKLKHRVESIRKVRNRGYYGLAHQKRNDRLPKKKHYSAFNKIPYVEPFLQCEKKNLSWKRSKTLVIYSDTRRRVKVWLTRLIRSLQTRLYMSTGQRVAHGARPSGPISCK